MKNHKLLANIIGVLLFTIFFPLTTNADSGTWELKFVMDADKSGQHLLHPGGLYVDQVSKRYYIIDSGRNRILSFDKDGQALSSFNAGGRFETPIAMAKYSDGRLLVVEKGKASVTLVDLKNKKVTPFSIANKYPQRLQINNGNLYILDKRSAAVMLLDKDFKIAKQFKCKDCQEYGFLDFKIVGDFLYGLTQNGELSRFDLQGKLIATTILNPTPDFAASFTIGENGRVYVVERHIGKVLVYNKNGKFDYTFLRHGQKADQLYYPAQIEFDPWGRLCIVDEGNGRVAVFAR